jgi:RNA polymerase sigma-70 factor (ECF subfamily)
VLILFDIEGHSYEEIAAALNLPLGTIKSRLNRARAQLREELQTARELFED